jgi:hypothetical protein
MIGYLGPWLAHPTAGLTLTGVDIGEFVKFLPGVLDGSVQIHRQAFYVTPFAVVLSMALLAGSHALDYPVGVRAAVVVAGVAASVQLLPPAWSPTSLFSPEFRLQALAVGLLWLLLASYRWFGRLPIWLAALLSGFSAFAALGLTIWQFSTVETAIFQVYATVSPLGWGLPVCMAGLAILALICTAIVVRMRRRQGISWTAR